MERVSLLVNKLQQLLQDEASPNVLLVIAQMLVTELQSAEIAAKPSSVSVIMPKRFIPLAAQMEEIKPPLPVTEVANEPVFQTIPPVELIIEENPIWETSPIEVDNLALAIEEVAPFIESTITQSEMPIETLETVAAPKQSTFAFDFPETVEIPVSFAPTIHETVTETAAKVPEKTIHEILQETIAQNASKYEKPRVDYVLEMPSPEPVEIVEEAIAIPAIVQEEKKESPLQGSIMDIKPVDYSQDTFTYIPTLPQLQAKQPAPKPVELEALPTFQESLVEEDNSINARFKESSKVEVAHLLENSHIKDLKRGIGINDRYLFIQELFHGDEALFDRSIKTIQGFSIFPEATFWIQRELKNKLKWPLNSEVVQLFDQLVKRRFS